MPTTLVLGCGVGGIVAATVLKKAMGDRMQVKVIEKEPLYHFTGSFPLLIVGKRQAEEITRDFSSLQKKGIDVLHTQAISLDLVRHQVETGAGCLTYDFLIIALGVEFHLETVPGFRENAPNIWGFEGAMEAAKRLAAMRSGHLVLFISSLPYRCPSASYEMMFLLDEFFIQKGIRNRVQLTLVTPDPAPEPLAGPLVGGSLRRMFDQRNIELITGAQVLSLDEDALILDHGGRVKGDLFLGIASHWTPEILRATDLVDREGWVLVDQHTLATIYPGVYAIGDCTALKLPVVGAYAPKAGIFAHYQAEVVARNIALKMAGKNPGHQYTGKGA